MDERLERLPSLPPGVNAKVYGLLNVEVGRMVWLETTTPPEHVSLRIRFFGEQTAGTVLRPSEPIRSYPSNVVQYTIRCNQQTFTKYLNDMSKLKAEVIDDAVNKVLGRVQVNLKLYLRKDESRGRSNLASDFGFSVLEVQGAFPIMSEHARPVKLGEIELFLKTDYTSWRGADGVRQSLLNSFIVNELRAEYDPSLPLRPNDDLRVPNSLAKAPRDEDYRPPVATLDQGEIVKVAKSALRKVERPIEREVPEVIPTAPERTVEPRESEGKVSDSADELIARLRERGEKLRQKMEESAKVPDFGADTSPALLDAGFSPTFGEFIPPEISEEAEDLAADIPLQASTPPPAPQFLDFPSVRYLKLSVTTLTVLDQSAIRDKVLMLECTVPTSGLQSVPTNKKHPSDQKPQIAIQTDVLKLSHKGGYENIFDFKHESRHNVSIGDGVIGALATQAIRFRLLATDVKGKESEVGRAELMWEKLLMAPGFAYSVVMELMPGAALEASKKQQRTKGPPIRMREVGRLTTKFELLPETKEEAVVKPAPTDTIPRSVADGEIPARETAREEITTKTFQMYLFVESAAQLEPRSDGALRNPYIRYKPFLESEFLTSAVLWDWEESSRFNHVLMTPIVTSEAVLGRLASGRLTIEVWDKRSPNDTELMGMVALPLAPLADAIASGAVGLPGSVYPLTAVDEYRAIHNPLKHQDVGYLRICLALGTPAQVQRLHDSHQSAAVRPAKEEPEVTLPKTVKTEEVGTSLTDFPSLPLRSPSPEKQPAKITDSVESISDIAAFLNRKEAPAAVPQSPKRPNPPESKSPEPIETPQAPAAEPVDIEELLPAVKEKMRTEDIDLGDELRRIDRLGNGFLHSESFARVLEELRIGLSQDEISALIDFILKGSDRSSVRRMYHSDILAVLGPSVKKTLNTRHVFEVTLTELTACRVLKMLPEKCAYLRLQFPMDDGVCESGLLPREERQALTMKSTHSCTVADGQTLPDCIPSAVPGVLIWLCRNEERCETHILGKAVLPTEELLDLAEEGGKLSRVLCLYADNNKDIHSLNSDIMGKVRCQVKYSQEKTSDFPRVSQSSELLMERHTTVEMAIPRYSVLTLFITAATNLDRGVSYYENQGVALGREMQGFVRVQLFHESSEDFDDIEEVATTAVRGSINMDFSQRFQVDVTMTEKAISYIQTKTALVELVITEPEVLVFGSSRVSLLPVLLSSVKGEFALLNVYGQYMGSVLLALSLNKEDYRPAYTAAQEKPVELPMTVSKPEEVPQPPVEDSDRVEELPPVDYLQPAEARPVVAKLLITVESAIRISAPASGGLPNPYVKLVWKDQDIGTTPPILRSTCPAWTSSFTLAITDEDLDEMKGKPLILVVFHKSLNDREEEFLGRATVDIGQLVKPGINEEISGWYHIILREEPAGQLKLRIAPSLNLYENFIKPRESAKSWSTLSFSHTDQLLRSSAYQSQIDLKLQSMEESLTRTRDQDLMALHTQKMRDLDQLNEYFSRKIGGEEVQYRPVQVSESIGAVPKYEEQVVVQTAGREEELVFASSESLEREKTASPMVPEDDFQQEDDFQFQPDEILKSIQEASEFAGAEPTFPLSDPVPVPEEPPLPPPEERKFRDVTPQSDPRPRPKERKPPSSRIKVDADELSRIEAIMRGSAKSTKSRPET